VTSATVKVHLDRTTVHIVIAGEIDLANVAVVEEEIFAAVDNKVTAVMLDITDLFYLDSSGLRTLFMLANRLEMLQTRRGLIAPHGSPIRRVIEMSGLDAFVELMH
jgi:anti-anti-sigma factor